LIAVSAADIPFIFFVALPGHVPLMQALPGPVLWLVAVVFSTLALQPAREQATS
jgi:hypothetical protein